MIATDQKAEQVTSDIVAQGGKVHVVVGDLTDDNAVERLSAESMQIVGTMDILINNDGDSGGSTDSWDAPRPNFLIFLRLKCLRRP